MAKLLSKLKTQLIEKGEKYIYPEQQEIAELITTAFLTGKRLVTLIAQPQWGKTGTIIATAINLCLEKEVIPGHVFTITGMSDKSWELQTRSRMLSVFQDGVFHRGKLHSAKAAISESQNSLLIIDECHYASTANQSIKKLLENCGLLDIGELERRNVYILQTSATPDNVLIDSESWGDYHLSISPDLSKSPSYYSFTNLKKDGRLREMIDLTDSEKLLELFSVINNFTDPLYHIIRIPRRDKSNRQLQIINLIKKIASEFGINVELHSSTSRIASVDQLLSTAPKNHLIILVIDFWRAAKTLNLQYLGIVHERSVAAATSSNTSTIVQSLAGRCVGHSNNKNLTHPIIYTDLEAIDNYINLCNYHFNYKSVKYKSFGVASNGKGEINYRESYTHSVNGIDQVYTKSIEKYGWKLFAGKSPLEKAKRFIIKYLSEKFPEKKMVNGFYVQNDKIVNPLYNYYKYFENDQPVVKRIFKGLSSENATKKTIWRQYALYKDITDPSTLVWFVCWRLSAFPNVPTNDKI